MPEPNNRPNVPKSNLPSRRINLNVSDSFNHYIGLIKLEFEYGLAQFSPLPPGVTIAVTLQPMTVASTSYSVNLTAYEFLKAFEKQSSLKPEDIYKIFIIGTQEYIENSVNDFKLKGISPMSIYTYDIDRYNKSFLSPWQFDPNRGYILVPGFHN